MFQTDQNQITFNNTQFRTSPSGEGNSLPSLFSIFLLHFPCPNSSVSFSISLYSRTCFPYSYNSTSKTTRLMKKVLLSLSLTTQSHQISLPTLLYPSPSQKMKKYLEFYLCSLFIYFVCIYVLGGKKQVYYIQAYRELDDIKWQCK